MMNLSIGLMSGTSMDGVDAALLSLSDDESSIIDLGHVSLDYAFESKLLFKAAEYSFKQAEGSIERASINFQQDLKTYLNDLTLCAAKSTKELLAFLNINKPFISLEDVIQHSTNLHIQCVQLLLAQTNYSRDQIAVIGYHGQTVYHKPEQRMSITLASPQYMADQLNIDVVHDFRREDVLAGGQGAPFAPLYHFALAKRDHKFPIGIINCGGIANVTIIPDNNLTHVHAFDTGPGNGLIDLLVRRHTHGKESMDRNGIYGSVGIVHDDVLQALHNTAVIKNGQNYLKASPPKSLDIADMQLIPEVLALNLNDACATLEAFTAMTIVDGLQLLPPEVTIPNHWVVCGGGWKNPVIKRAFDAELSKLLGKNIILQTADDIGWNSVAMEAQIFAYLAIESLRGKPLSLPNTTGVPRPMTGGTHYKKSFT
ncbi:MAG: anhydro-N-acetylmuramic acid kinase [Candidatus Paracaedibacteraceae bacterium]|nr:anhydro-N-acetylmuramic acid kinase [Candidatus Paracaedibacteraceae bacterium]